MIGSRTNGIRQVRSVLAPTVHVGSRLHRGDHRFLAGLDVVAASPRRLSTEQNKLAKSDQSRQWGRVTQVKAVGVMPQVKAVMPQATAVGPQAKAVGVMGGSHVSRL